ncbi:unnamed protein product, partial [Polarella glacialis]
MGQSLIVTAAACLLPATNIAAVAGQSSGRTNSSSSYASGADAPRLQFLGLRCADRPVDVHPAFSSTHYVYSAVLDYAEGSFAVDAEPAKTMKIVNAPELQTTQLIAPGDELPVGIKVLNPSAQESMDYSISIRRLDGTDVQLKGLASPGADLAPSFSSGSLDYTVRMPAELDRLDLRIVPMDSGQTFEVRSLPPDFQ